MATVPPVKSGYIGNGSKVRLNYLEWGDPDAPSVVLIIGLTAQAYNWRTTAEALQDRYRCIAINLRGHGDSSPFPNRTPNSPGDDRWGDWASDVHALVQELGLKKPVVMGHSLGARVAYCYAAYYPDEPRSVVVIDNGPGFPPMVALNVPAQLHAQPVDGIRWMARSHRLLQDPPRHVLQAGQRRHPCLKRNMKRALTTH